MKTVSLLVAGLSPLALAQTLVTVIPTPQGTETASEAITVSDSFDGGLKLYDRSPRVCEEQTETGRADAMFILEDGASISNVIIGPDQAEGIHCLGSCTITNVYFQDVCEDAITGEGPGNIQIVGGAAFGASDKIIQLNDVITLDVSFWYAEDYGKAIRSCGNCQPNPSPRIITVSDSQFNGDGPICGINTNLGDTCTVVDSCQSEGKSCDLFEGNDDGSEPDKIGSGPDGESCFVTNLTEGC